MIPLMIWTNNVYLGPMQPLHVQTWNFDRFKYFWTDHSDIKNCLYYMTLLHPELQESYHLHIAYASWLSGASSEQYGFKCIRNFSYEDNNGYLLMIPVIIFISQKFRSDVKQNNKQISEFKTQIWKDPIRIWGGSYMLRFSAPLQQWCWTSFTLSPTPSPNFR